MIVYVAFQFDGVEPNSKRADEINEMLAESCDAMQEGFEASGCWVDNAVGSTDAASYT
jgi:hypothetical protein